MSNVCLFVCLFVCLSVCACLLSVLKTGMELVNALLGGVRDSLLDVGGALLFGWKYVFPTGLTPH